MGAPDTAARHRGGDRSASAVGCAERGTCRSGVPKGRPRTVGAHEVRGGLGISALLVSIALLAGLPCFVGTLRAEEEQAAPSKEDKVRSLLALPGGSQEILRQTVERLRAMRSILPGVAEKFEEAFRSEELVEILVPIFVEHLDEKAIDALLAFNASPEGRRVTKALPKIQAEAESAAAEWVRALLDRAREEAREERTRALMPEPGLVIGEGVLEQDWFAEDLRVGVVTDIRRADLDLRPGLEIAIAGSRGALLADDETRRIIVSLVTFTPPARDALVVDADADGQCEYCERRGGLDLFDVMERSKTERNWKALDLLDHEGHVRWSYGGEEEVLSMTAGNLDDDAEAEFVVGFAGAGGLHVVDHEGNLVRSVPGERVWQVEVADLDGDGTPEIVHTDAQDRLTLRNAKGQLLRRLSLPEKVSGFSVCSWPAAGDPCHLLVRSRTRALRLLDVHGNAAHVFALPEGPPLEGAWGTPFVLTPGAAPGFALVVHFAGSNPARRLLQKGPTGALLVYESEGRLVYHEVLEELGRGLATIPGEETGAESLLVAYEDGVYRYTARREREGDEAGGAEAARDPDEAGGFHPEIHWDGSRARVVLDRATRDHLRTADPAEILAPIRTEPARDAGGTVLGLRITGLAPGSPVRALGLRAGDVLLSIDATPIRGRAETVTALERLDPSRTGVTLRIDRNGRLLTFDIDTRDPEASEAEEHR